MIINRFILRKFGLFEYDIGRMQNIARCSSGVRTFDKMTTADNGYLTSTPHLDIFEWIEMQRERIKTIRSMSVEPNQKLLERVEKAFKIEMEKRDETTTINTN